MSDFSTFPSGKISALAMLYLEHQDIPGLTPEELLDKYHKIYNCISEHDKKRSQENPPNWFK